MKKAHCFALFKIKKKHKRRFVMSTLREDGHPEIFSPLLMIGKRQRGMTTFSRPQKIRAPPFPRELKEEKTDNAHVKR